MELSDIPRKAEIHVFGWRSAYRGIVSDEHLFKNMLVSKDIERFSKDENLYVIKNSFVYDDGIIKAILTIGPCRDEDKPNSFELWGIYVDPFFQRQGVGSQMVEFCEKIAVERGFNEVCIWVLEKNTNARKFYEKLGYNPDGASKLIELLSVTEVRYIKQI